MLARRVPQAASRSVAFPVRRKRAWLAGSAQCKAAQDPVVTQGGPSSGLGCGEGAGSASSAGVETEEARGEAGSDSEESCRRAQRSTSAASESRLGRLGGCRGSAGGVAGGVLGSLRIGVAGEGDARGAVAESSWREAQRRKAGLASSSGGK